VEVLAKMFRDVRYASVLSMSRWRFQPQLTRMRHPEIGKFECPAQFVFGLGEFFLIHLRLIS